MLQIPEKHPLGGKYHNRRTAIGRALQALRVVAYGYVHRRVNDAKRDYLVSECCRCKNIDNRLTRTHQLPTSRATSPYAAATASSILPISLPPA